MDLNNELLLKYIEVGGLVVVYENGYILILKGDWILRIEKVVNVLIIMVGKVLFMIVNVLVVCLVVFS